MSESIKERASQGIRRAMLAILAAGVLTTSVVEANASSNIVVLTPTVLPELARQAGEAMLLRETNNGRALLYVEQQQGARLAIFDVTDPVHIKAEGDVSLSTDGAFDFVCAIGAKQELIEYRQDHREAVLDFQSMSSPKIKSVQGLTLRGPITALGNDGFMVAGEGASAPSSNSFQVVDSMSSPVVSTVLDVKHVTETISKTDTGTTFFLAKEGLFVVRRPAIELAKKERDEEWLSEHSGS